MAVVWTIAGIALIVIGLRDMFHSLLHPRGSGAVSNALMSWLWGLSRRSGHRLGSAAGPAGMVSAVIAWVLLQAVGWALVYLPHVPHGFSYSPGIEPTRYFPAAEALYISLVSLATLGFGDVVPTDPWLRVFAPLQALTGFALLTVSLTWFTQVFPPVARRRALALHLNALAESGYAERLDEEGADFADQVLMELAREINTTTVDLTQHSESYYFREDDPAMSLARQLPYVLTLGDAAATCRGDRSVAGAALTQSVEHLARTLHGFVESGDDPREVLAAYAADQRRTPRA